MRKIVLFDVENQSAEIETFKSWNPGAYFDFRGYTIKDAIEDFDPDGFDLSIFLIGSSTRYLNKQFAADAAQIIRRNHPILCLNLNGTIGLDEDNCPVFLHNVGAIHMPFTKEDIAFSLLNIKPDARISHPDQSFHFRSTPRSWDEE